LRVHRLVFFSGTSRRCSRGVQAVCQPGFPWKRKPDRDVVVKEKPLTHSNRQGMHEPEEGRPPVFKSWNTWYWLVLGLFILQVIIYYFITSAFLCAASAGSFCSERCSPWWPTGHGKRAAARRLR